ncbi:ABC transporter ATP-binding protein [Peptostreptococcus porci]|uniref:ABC transporter ATP-binding protein n=1 Tax=Peptostreptococcus porci TaxID=2652282 RepID=UPI0023F307D3|nr:ABC transporter ATP-binding protein [Peptostreptococcus porci]MDD7182302.1 ABC transporter ATP-binding protein [Peptostreptococcus porci]MDY2794109.1 ABC transporter ATP-binding protein [Peptostreptococcus porci]MDY4561845.1 ABC transporter ATP-binding protein [Peptostreptococcus porci]MDY5963733.1 ABC transporter ATP-binding protein [Peptostreptococcus porci]MDY6232746.1 ABC transporter ATP-binding protein [Peptostreptococcus porci]
MIKLENIEKTYGNKKIFSDYCLNIEKGEFIAIFGVSGCGKSSLLNCIGLLDDIDKGNIFIDGVKINKVNSKVAMLVRRHKIAYMFQTYALVEESSVFENLKLAFEYKKNKKKDIISEKIDYVLEKLDLLDKKFNYVYELSGGEQQRVAFARVLLQDPEIILADEPTGSLDRCNKLKILELLSEEHKKGKTIVVVSHDEEIKKYSSRVIEL